MKQTKKKPLKEKDIQKAILAWLEANNLCHWRQNAGVLPIKNPVTQKITRVVRLGAEGIPDIIVVLPPRGHMVGLEVKTQTGKLRPKQKEFHAKLSDVGATPCVVRSLEEAAKCIMNQMEKEAQNKS